MTQHLCVDDYVIAESSDLRVDAQMAYNTSQVNGWRFAVLLHRIRATGIYAEWRDAEGNQYRSLYDWASKEIPSIKSPSTITRYAQAGKMIEDATPDERERWLAVPVTNAIEVMSVARENPKQALDVIESSASQAEVRRKVRDGGVIEGEVRTIRWTVSEDTYREVMEAIELIRVSCGSNGTAHPSIDEVLIAMALSVKHSPELLLVGNRMMTDEEMQSVFAGEVKCQSPGCGSYAHLERHHVIPRSHGGVDEAGIEQLMWLCHVCHERVTRGTDEHWRDAAERAGINA